MDKFFAESEMASLKRRVLGEYQKALDELAPITLQLKRTDALIDQIVYRLYGLSPEEIAIVEGKREEAGQEISPDQEVGTLFPDAEFQASREGTVAESEAIIVEKEVDR